MAEKLFLHDFWRARGARFYEDYGIELPRSFEDSKAEYEKLTTSAGLVDFSARGKLRVTGADRLDVLQRLLTQDLRKLKPGQSTYSAFLTSRGKVVADMAVYLFEDHILLDTEIGIQKKLMEGLNKLIILEDIQIEDTSCRDVHLALIAQTEKLCEKFKLKLSDKPGAVQVLIEGIPALLLMRKFREYTWLEVLAKKTDAEKLAAALLESSACFAAGYEAYEAWRIERGILRYGKDITEEVTLPETLLDDITASETKGCYPGQEVVARTNTYKGHTKKCLRLKLDEIDIRDDKIYVDGKEAGRITSTSALCGMVIGYIAKDYFNCATFSTRE